MAKALDFTKLKKRYFPVTLEDGTALQISMPTKSIMDGFISMKDTLTAENMGDDAITELYEICARIMSRNKTGIKITTEMLEDMFDFGDVITFIRGYSEFISEISNEKN